ncbi:MAG: hypothetical protein SVT52_02895 [Planctomycetota bacterium]|nr:hypothetical protein [Planctomycetota bacterium]
MKSRLRRRLLFALLLIGLLLVVLIWLGPYLASTDTATRWIVSFVDGGLAGRFHIEDLSLNWLGPCRVRGLELSDPSGREVLAIEQITYAPGAWGAMTAVDDFQQVRVGSPHITLYVDKDNRVSISEAVKPRGWLADIIASPRKKKKRPLRPRGQILLTNATIQVIRPDGKSLLGQGEQLSLDWSGRLDSSDELVSAAGQAIIAMLAADTDKPHRRELLQFSHDVAVNRHDDDITLRAISIASSPATLQLAGTIRKYRTDRELKLNVDYDICWQEVMLLLHDFAPDAAEAFSLTGRLQNSVEITGPAYRPRLRPVYRGVKTDSINVGWDSGLAYGLTLGQCLLMPMLQEGQVHLPAAEIPASGGKINLAGLVDLRQGDPILRIDKPLAVLDRVKITPEMGQHLLSRVNPIFADLAGIEGEVSFSLADVELPLSGRIKRSGRARGRLDLSDMKIQPRGLLGNLLQLGGRTSSEAQTVRVRSVDFVIRDGRLSYDNFTLVFGDTFDLRFSGSVGFDDTLDLTVSVPIRLELLKVLGVRPGLLAEYARLLADLRVEVPILGERTRPRLSLAGVDVRKLLAGASERLLSKEARQRLGELLRPKRDRSGTRNRRPTQLPRLPATQPAPE